MEANQTLRRHKLLTKELEAKLPALYATDENQDARAVVKFFSPYTGWTWFAFEYDPEERMFFGFVKGFENEWGYFSLDELAETTVHGGVPAVERDCYIDDERLPTKNDLNGVAV